MANSKLFIPCRNHSITRVIEITYGHVLYSKPSSMYAHQADCCIKESNAPCEVVLNETIFHYTSVSTWHPKQYLDRVDCQQSPPSTPVHPSNFLTSHSLTACPHPHPVSQYTPPCGSIGVITVITITLL